ncbi:hypothetical protein SAMN06298226_2320 [Nitrosovibrio sp. Nv4]|nr:hypothetical protein SAMN06298226_2320 [Nitrosovibrio sp. Nv4]
MVLDFRSLALFALNIEASTDRMGTIAAYFVPMQGHNAIQGEETSRNLLG